MKAKYSQITTFHYGMAISEESEEFEVMILATSGQNGAFNTRILKMGIDGESKTLYKGNLPFEDFLPQVEACLESEFDGIESLMMEVKLKFRCGAIEKASRLSL